MDQVNIEMSVPKKRKRKTTKEPYGFQCPFCGGFTTNPQEYYSSLTSILITRFMRLLKSSKEPAYQEAVLDAVNAIFGVENKLARKELVKAGFLDVFDNRHEYIYDDCYSTKENGGKQNGTE